MLNSVVHLVMMVGLINLITLFLNLTNLIYRSTVSPTEIKRVNIIGKSKEIPHFCLVRHQSKDKYVSLSGVEDPGAA